MNRAPINRLTGLACGLFALYIVYRVGQGLMSGEMLKLSKFGHEIILLANQPERYWLEIGFWSLGAVLLLVLEYPFCQRETGKNNVSVLGEFVRSLDGAKRNPGLILSSTFSPLHSRRHVLAATFPRHILPPKGCVWRQSLRSQDA
jgi:hypothetical protein